MKKNTIKWYEFPISIKLIFYLYAVCFLSGGLRHWIDIARDGIFPYKTVPFLFNFYLTSLAIFDFVVIILLLIRPIYALILAIVIMASDLMVDFYVGYYYWNIQLSTNLGLQLLVLFGVFVFISAPLLIQRFRDI